MAACRSPSTGAGRRSWRPTWRRSTGSRAAVRRRPPGQLRWLRVARTILLFDINDFDETHPGPFEWDLKRLAASFEIACRSRRFARDRHGRVRGVKTYRGHAPVRHMSNLDIWYPRLDADGSCAVQHRGGKAASAAFQNVAKAQSRIAEGQGQVDRAGRWPPPVRERSAAARAGRTALLRRRTSDLDQVRDSSPATSGPSPDRRACSRARFVDLARKVVGVGSVGTRAWVALLVGRDDHDPLFLQVKEAEASVLEPYLGRSPFRSTANGWSPASASCRRPATSCSDGSDHRHRRRRRDYYVRQLWDWKASADLETIRPSLGVYAEICGWTLARAHARSGDPMAIASYLGRGTSRLGRWPVRGGLRRPERG